MRLPSGRVQLLLVIVGVLLLCLGVYSAALAYPPDQAEAGAKIYTDRCSTCHGDVGQGLTDEFRATWAEGDRNCWIPACHGGSPRKPDGFSIPRTVPALIGPGTLTKFPDALALHAFIKARMPMQEPGVLTDEDYWALTAFLLRGNGVPPDGRPLDAATGASVAVPRSGQPVPVPNRVVEPTNKMPLQPRERVAPLRSTSTVSGQTVSEAARADASQDPGNPAGSSPASQQVPATPPLMPVLWTLALALAIALPVLLLRTTRRSL